MKKIRIDGVDYDVPEQSAAALAKDSERRDAAEAVLKDKADSERKRADKAEAERDQAKAQLTEATDPAKRADAIKSRVELERNAAKVLGDAERFDSLDDRKVREKVLAKLSPSVKLDGKSDEYVTAAYEVALASAPARNDGLSLLGSALNHTPTERVDEASDLDAAYSSRFAIFKKGA
jgi:hypothetical protein